MRDFITAALLVGLIGSAQAFQNRPPMTDAEASAAADTVISTCNLPSSKQVAARVLTRIYDWQNHPDLSLDGPVNAATQLKQGLAKYRESTCESFSRLSPSLDAEIENDLRAFCENRPGYRECLHKIIDQACAAHPSSDPAYEPICVRGRANRP